MSYYDLDWAPRFDFGGPRSIQELVGVCIHTSEGNPNISAQDLALYQINSETGSYHVIVDKTGLRLRENSDDWITWSTGNIGNNILVHLCFTARADWSRAEWLAQETMLRAGATVVAHWCRTYGWPAERVYANSLPGVLGHDDTRVWGGTNHTDPGPNFPYDVFLGYVREVLTGNQEDSVNRIRSEQIQDFIVGFCGPIGADIKDVREQLTGGRDAGQYPGWPQLDDKTVVDALADVLDRVKKLEGK